MSSNVIYTYTSNKRQTSEASAEPLSPTPSPGTPKRTSLEVFLNLKNKVKKREKKIRAMLDPKPKHKPVPPLHDVSDITDVASLAYHGILGPVRGLHLQHVDISPIPTCT